MSHNQRGKNATIHPLRSTPGNRTQPAPIHDNIRLVLCQCMRYQYTNAEDVISCRLSVQEGIFPLMFSDVSTEEILPDEKDLMIHDPPGKNTRKTKEIHSRFYPWESNPAPPIHLQAIRLRFYRRAHSVTLMGNWKS